MTAHAIPQHRAITGVFFIQYLSVMLIILTVIAGTLTRRTSVALPVEAPAVPQGASIFSPARPLSEWTPSAPLPTLYAECQVEGMWDPFREVLAAHDVTLAAELEVGSVEEGISLADLLRISLLSVSMENDAVLVSFRIAQHSVGPRVRTRWLAPLYREGQIRE